MNLLHQLLGIGHPQQKHPQPPMAQQTQNGLVDGHQPQPGYHDAAVAYSKNIAAGGTGGPIDPMHFGYPADNSGSQLQINQAAGPYMIGGQLQPRGYNPQTSMHSRMTQGTNMYSPMGAPNMQTTRNAAYLQSGGIPSFGGGIYEDANTNYLNDPNLRLR